MNKTILSAKQDKKNFGMLQQFEDLIIFAHGNTQGKSGVFLDFEPDAMRKVITSVLKDNPQLRELFREAVNESIGIIVIPK